ncbi:unnamed protein product [Cuscuta epithymum]|uniref:Uncharacterized protein n=1 Tax=Cuscuta epithymum TaxID=186058 RepID=A0AAV0E496_9ASTE|nr:unnamed protein product [Cuscuta epithymum]
MLSASFSSVRPASHLPTYHRLASPFYTMEAYMLNPMLSVNHEDSIVFMDESNSSYGEATRRLKNCLSRGSRTFDTDYRHIFDSIVGISIHPCT